MRHDIQLADKLADIQTLHSAESACEESPTSPSVPVPQRCPASIRAHSTCGNTVGGTGFHRLLLAQQASRHYTGRSVGSAHDVHHASPQPAPRSAISSSAKQLRCVLAKRASQRQRDPLQQQQQQQHPPAPMPSLSFEAAPPPCQPLYAMRPNMPNLRSTPGAQSARPPRSAAGGPGPGPALVADISSRRRSTSALPAQLLTISAYLAAQQNMFAANNGSSASCAAGGSWHSSVTGSRRASTCSNGLYGHNGMSSSPGSSSGPPTTAAYASPTVAPGGASANARSLRMLANRSSRRGSLLPAPLSPSAPAPLPASPLSADAAAQATARAPAGQLGARGAELKGRGGGGGGGTVNVHVCAHEEGPTGGSVAGGSSAGSEGAHPSPGGKGAGKGAAPGVARGAAPVPRLALWACLRAPAADGGTADTGGEGGARAPGGGAAAGAEAGLLRRWAVLLRGALRPRAARVAAPPRRA